MAEANQINFAGRLALPKQNLAGLTRRNVIRWPQEIDDLVVLIVGKIAKQVGALQDKIERTIAILGLEFRAPARQAHEAVEHIAAHFPNLGVLEHGDVGRARRAAQARHLADDQIFRCELRAKESAFDFSRKNPPRPADGRTPGSGTTASSLPGFDNEGGVARFAFAAENLSGAQLSPNDQSLLPEEKLRRDAVENRIAQQFRGGKNFRATRAAARLHRSRPD